MLKLIFHAGKWTPYLSHLHNERLTLSFISAATRVVDLCITCFSYEGKCDPSSPSLFNSGNQNFLFPTQSENSYVTKLKLTKHISPITAVRPRLTPTGLQGLLKGSLYPFLTYQSGLFRKHIHYDVSNSARNVEWLIIGE